MPTEAAALAQIAAELKAQGKTFEELPKLRQMIEATQQCQGVELKARAREIDFDYGTTVYTCDDQGQVIGLHLFGVHLADYDLLQNFPQLTWVYLYENQLTILTFLASLTHLTQLFLGYNQISDLMPMAGLTRLTRLALSSNRISDLTPLANLMRLTELVLGGNQISDLPPLAGLTHLTTLVLGDNRVSDLTPLAGLTHLTQLDVSYNQISNLTPLIGIHRLQFLDVGRNHIKRLPKALIESDLEIHWKEAFYSHRGDTGLNLYDNPLEAPPVEIVKQGKAAILAWFQAIDNDALRLNQVKVLLVGDGGAGKTSLVKRLMGDAFDHKEPQTHGIRIRDWRMQDDHGMAVKVHFWDFGGQEIMHATHQFFLSKRSLYILVLDSRKDEKIEYWLKHIASFGGDSPVLVVLNKIDEHPGFEVNRRFLQDKYPAIQGFYRVSCATGTGIQAFRDDLQHTLLRVELLRTTWPTSWFMVKKKLERSRKHFISYDDYRTFCRKATITNPSAQETLVSFLHDLGIVLHFKDMALLDTQVLNPKWVTDAVYRIINSEQLAQGKGILRLDSLDAILQPKTPEDYDYPPDKYRFIIELMKKFELCYELEHDRDRVLIPDLLDVPEPAFDFDYATALKFRLQYDFLPRSVLPRFIVRMHGGIQGELRWRTGVVLHYADLQATSVVKADHEERTIAIWVQGERRREYFAIVRKTFQDIHASFEKLDVTELVPLPDHPEVTVDYAELIGLERMGERTITIGKLRKKYQVAELLDGLEVRHDWRSEIVECLLALPQIHVREAQDALIASAGVDAELQAQIQFGLPKAQFVRLLVETCDQYGQLADGRPALVAVLQAARDLVGKDGRAHCDRLIREMC